MRALVLLGLIACGGDDPDDPSVVIYSPTPGTGITLTGDVVVRANGRNLETVTAIDVSVGGAQMTVKENSFPFDVCDTCNFMVTFTPAGISAVEATIRIEMQRDTDVVASDEVDVIFLAPGQ